MPGALIVQGGWEGHQPKEVAAIFERLLVAEGFDVEVASSLDALLDGAKLRMLHLIVPIWTMGKIAKEQLQCVTEAVGEGGVGIAGCHGGMCDAFREATEWQFMTGGQWVAHPGNDTVTYTVHLTDRAHPMTAGLDDFSITSEQYYMHVDPANHVLATTQFPSPGGAGPHEPNGVVQMPQLWTKRYGAGRVFYSALGHQAAIFDHPTARELMRRGFLWAARSS